MLFLGCTKHISSAQKACVARGYHIGQCRRDPDSMSGDTYTSRPNMNFTKLKTVTAV